jgi:uncharacterized protein YndB with AHSA1/START domain
MDYEQTVRVKADASRTWQALAAVTTYPQWTKSMTSVTALDGPSLETGNRFRIVQPAMPALTWRVTEVHEGLDFRWETRSPGVHTVASHELTAETDGGTRVTLRVQQSGPLSGLVGLLTGSRTRRYMALEAAGLKAAAESA